MKRLGVLFLLVGLVVGGLWLADRLRWTRPAPVVDITQVAPARKPPGSAPNVVLVVGCSVRADQTSPVNPHLATTPFLGELARDGVRFTDTIAQAPWTKPAVTTIITGFEPLQTGIPDMGDGVNTKVLEANNVTLAERFQAAGYTTVGATANPNINALFGFDQGFDVYVDTPNLWRDFEGKVDGGDVVDDALALVARLKAAGKLGPLYLQLVLVDAHFPATNVTDDDVADFSEGVPRRVAQYRAMLYELDEHVRALFDGLEAQGIAKEDLLFVFIGDHGDGLHYPAEHHGIGHGNYLYESTVQVPWILWGLDLPARARITGTSAQVDLVPTLLDIAGLDASDYAGPGRSHLARMRAESAAERMIDLDRSVFSDTWFKDSNRAAVYTRKKMCQHNFGAADAKFPDACFDRNRDPNAAHPIEDAALTQALLDWRTQRVGEYEGRGASREADLEPGLVRQLKALGYVE